MKGDGNARSSAWRAVLDGTLDHAVEIVLAGDSVAELPVGAHDSAVERVIIGEIVGLLIRCRGGDFDTVPRGCARSACGTVHRANKPGRLHSVSLLGSTSVCRSLALPAICLPRRACGSPSARRVITIWSSCGAGPRS